MEEKNFPDVDKKIRSYFDWFRSWGKKIYKSGSSESGPKDE